MTINGFFLELIISYVVIGIAATGFVVTLFWVYPRFKERVLSLTYKKATRVFLFLLFVYALFFSIFAVIRYDAFIPAVLDQGNMEQTLWNTANGNFFRMTTIFPAESRLFFHVEPVFLLLAPFFKLFPDGRWLLILQTLVLATGAIPLFLLAKNNKLPAFFALSFAVMYLLFPALHQANLRDFHPLALGAPLLIWAVWALQKKNWILVWIFLLLAIACREEYAAMVALFGLVILLRKKEWLQGGALFLVGALWCLFVLMVAFPTFSPNGIVEQFGLYGELGSSPGAIIHAAISDPIVFLTYLFAIPRINYLLFLLLPVAFLPFRSFAWLVTGSVSFLTIYLRPENTFFVGFMHQHISLIAPIFLSCLWAVVSLYGKSRDRALLWVSSALLVSFGVLLFHQFMPLQYGANLKTRFTNAQQDELSRIAETIPKSASVMTTNFYGARISQRPYFYLMEAYPQIQADFIVIPKIDRTCFQWVEVGKTCSGQTIVFEEMIENIVSKGTHVVVSQEQGIVVLQRLVN